MIEKLRIMAGSVRLGSLLVPLGGTQVVLGVVGVHPHRPTAEGAASAGKVTGRATGATSPTPEGCFVANIKSQIKRIATNEKARLRNKAVRSSLKTSVRRFREAAAAGDAAQATEALRVASRQLDKAASKGVIHQNQAANRKSAMAKRVSSL
jgi:small subunit ribosomal protein S20